MLYLKLAYQRDLTFFDDTGKADEKFFVSFEDGVRDEVANKKIYEFAKSHRSESTFIVGALWSILPSEDHLEPKRINL